MSDLTRTCNKSQRCKDKVFTADYAVAKMIGALLNLTKEETGKLFAWDGKEIGF